MRIESSITSVSWIPREAVEGINRLAFESGVAQYDMPPPDRVDDFEELVVSGRCRFVNRLEAWIEVSDGRVVDHGQGGVGLLSPTELRLGPAGLRFAALALPELRPSPQVSEDSVRFAQTAGGQTGVAVPRRVRRRPFIQWVAPTAWTTLALTVRADGSSELEVVGASSFPRHWIYNHEGTLTAKSGVIDFDTWYREAFGSYTPWGDRESKALITAVESSLERELSAIIIGSNPPFRKLRKGDTLVRQDQPGDELFLLFDGILEVERDGRVIAEVGPGAILGEGALLEGRGRRSATLRAITPCRVAVVPGNRIDRERLAELDRGRRPPER